MKIKHYQFTALETWIEELYIKHQIDSVELLNIDDMARRFNVWIYYKPIKSKGLEVHSNMYTMIIDSRLSPTLQWLAFLHELCHLLRHVGNQTKLPELFTKGQEDEAEQFVLYAAMPILMISKLHMPPQKDKAIEYLSRTFAIPRRMAELRLNQIHRREFQGAIDSVLAEQNNASVSGFASKEEPSIQNIKLFSYYDSSADVSGPSQIVIEVDSATMNSSGEFYFSEDSHFDELEIEDFYGYKCTQLSVRDLKYKDDKIGLNFPTLSLLYGRTSKRFVLQMKDVEQFLELERGF
ncbi:ImmA/IrrE family metallo-endopeptidase [Paenibacillus dokdonensis]|uniref:ImmA/IrrE family metallo-endopeptidase n=1 Tax=Paenibacillus dokdonensis TaxID=2567944 RepID=UPI0010A92D6A|nr:ImmA/IrrE family metallo-endopeptidase [Paenibacillus dokdonensis]